MIKKIIALSLCAVSLAHGVMVKIAVFPIPGGYPTLKPIAQHTTVAALNNALQPVLSSSSSKTVEVMTIDPKFGHQLAIIKVVVPVNNLNQALTQQQFNQLSDGDFIIVR